MPGKKRKKKKNGSSELVFKLAIDYFLSLRSSFSSTVAGYFFLYLRLPSSSSFLQPTLLSLCPLHPPSLSLYIIIIYIYTSV